MTIKKTSDGGMIFTGRASVEAFRFATLVSALRLEIKGIQAFRGKGARWAAYTALMIDMNFQGTKEEVLAEAERRLHLMQANLGTVQGEQ